MKIIYSLIILFLLWFSWKVSHASESLKIWTIERAPFSYQENWEWKGFSIDLWTEVAQRNDFLYSFQGFSDFSKMLDATENETVNLSVANISITADREKIFNFSTPIYDSGLNILQLSQNNVALSFYTKYSIKFFFWLKIIAAVLLIITHYFFFTNVVKWNIDYWSYPREIFSIFFEVVRQIKETFGLKLILPISWILAILMISFMTQKFTLILNDVEANSRYGVKTLSFTELAWKKVWVTIGSVWESFLEKKSIKTEGYATLWEMYDSLEAWKLDALVSDEPVLRYHSKKNSLFQVTGRIFNRDQYAILFPQLEDTSNSTFIKNINVTLLEIQEEGKYDEIYNKYF